MKNLINLAVNQFTFSDEQGNKFFKSYNTVIAKRTVEGIVTLDPKHDYSKTTARYRNEFLGETTKEVLNKIKKGDYKIENLNK